MRLNSPTSLERSDTNSTSSVTTDPSTSSLLYSCTCDASKSSYPVEQGGENISSSDHSCPSGYSPPCGKLCINHLSVPSKDLDLLTTHEKVALLRSISSSSSDEDMNVNSPDSGFDSSASTGRNSVVDFVDEIDELSKSSSQSSSSFTPLCLTRPAPNPPQIAEPVEIKKPTQVCMWKDCGHAFDSHLGLQDHVNTQHVDAVEERFACQWKGCRVFDLPARNRSCLRLHVSTHTGQKRFKCLLDGCGATFSTSQGVARHLPSHYNDFNIPKARVPSNAERRLLVKRRKIRDERKALANIHDCVDQGAMEFIQNFLVRRVEEKRDEKMDDGKVCRRLTTDGSRWSMDANKTWCRVNFDRARPDPFFSRPTKRKRKMQIPS